MAKVTRDGQDYIVLQLFKDSGTAIPESARVIAPEAPKPPQIPIADKAKFPSALTQAAWPVMAVDADGKIVDANPSAGRIFGPAAVAKGLALAGISTPEESDSI